MSLHLHSILVLLFSGLIVLFTLVDNLSSLVGMYVMVIGAYIAEQSKDNYPAIKVPFHSLTLSSLPFFLACLCSIDLSRIRSSLFVTSLLFNVIAFFILKSSI